MRTKKELIAEIERLAKEQTGKVWKVNPLNFYRGYKNRTVPQLLDLLGHLQYAQAEGREHQKDEKAEAMVS